MRNPTGTACAAYPAMVSRAFTVIWLSLSIQFLAVDAGAVSFNWAKRLARHHARVRLHKSLEALANRHGIDQQGIDALFARCPRDRERLKAVRVEVGKIPEKLRQLKRDLHGKLSKVAVETIIRAVLDGVPIQGFGVHGWQFKGMAWTEPTLFLSTAHLVPTAAPDDPRWAYVQARSREPPPIVDSTRTMVGSEGLLSLDLKPAIKLVSPTVRDGTFAAFDFALHAGMSRGVYLIYPETSSPAAPAAPLAFKPAARKLKPEQLQRMYTRLEGLGGPSLIAQGVSFKLIPQRGAVTNLAAGAIDLHSASRVPELAAEMTPNQKDRDVQLLFNKHGQVLVDPESWIADFLPGS